MNNATIYTDIKSVVYQGLFMVIKCSRCFREKEKYRYRQCEDCCNEMRRNRYKKSVCRFCSVAFRPGIEGRYKFCSESCRFMHKVDKISSPGCWIWKGHVQKKAGGYGTFQEGASKASLAHRVSFRIFNGSIDNTKFVLHSCHNPVCVNPEHLRQGTPMDNTLDRKMAGRTTNRGKKEN